jgi:hypothetical protein
MRHERATGRDRTDDRSVAGAPFRASDPHATEGSGSGSLAQVGPTRAQTAPESVREVSGENGWLRLVRPGHAVVVFDDRKTERCSVIGVDDVWESDTGTLFFRLPLFDSPSTALGDGWVHESAVRPPEEGLPVYGSRTRRYAEAEWCYAPRTPSKDPKKHPWARKTYTSKDPKQSSLFGDKRGAV